MYLKRFLLLSNNAVIGIVKKKSNDIPTNIIMSPNGDYVLFMFGEEKSTYLTRFVPSKFYELTAMALSFRNRHVHLPYLCDHFHDSNQHYSVNRPKEESSANKSINQENANEAVNWYGYKINDGSFKIYLCPYQRRLYVAIKVAYYPETNHYLSSNQQVNQIKVNNQKNTSSKFEYNNNNNTSNNNNNKELLTKKYKICESIFTIENCPQSYLKYYKDITSYVSSEKEHNSNVPSSNAMNNFISDIPASSLQYLPPNIECQNTG